MLNADNVLQVLPISEAAQRLGLSEKALTQLIEAGKIQAAQTPSGELLVVVDNNSPQTKEDIINKKYRDLKNHWVSVSEASDKYGVLGRTIREWITRGYIKVDNSTYPLQVNEADVAYCADVYHSRQGISGVPLLDENGLPYKIKHPDLAKYRRRKRLQLRENKLD